MRPPPSEKRCRIPAWSILLQPRSRDRDVVLKWGWTTVLEELHAFIEQVGEGRSDSLREGGMLTEDEG